MRRWRGTSATGDGWMYCMNLMEYRPTESKAWNSGQGRLSMLYFFSLESLPTLILPGAYRVHVVAIYAVWYWWKIATASAEEIEEERNQRATKIDEQTGRDIGSWLSKEVEAEQLAGLVVRYIFYCFQPPRVTLSWNAGRIKAGVKCLTCPWHLVNHGQGHVSSLCTLSSLIRTITTIFQ
jgi:hypothetical protein